MNINQSANAVFSISIDALTPLGTLAQFPFNLGNGTYNYNFTFSEVIGIIDEDYETGNFTNYAWTHNNFPWFIDSVQPYEGAFCSQSFNGLPDGEESELFISVNVLETFDGAMEKHGALFFFVPLIAAMAGNVGVRMSIYFAVIVGQRRT